MSESMIALKVATDVCTMCLIVSMCLNFATNKLDLLSFFYVLMLFKCGVCSTSSFWLPVILNNP